MSGFFKQSEMPDKLRGHVKCVHWLSVICKDCGSLFSTATNLNKHVRKVYKDRSKSDGPHTCQMFKGIFMLKHRLEKHVKNMTCMRLNDRAGANEQKKTWFACTYPACTKTFTQKISLKRHLKKFDEISNTFQCNDCDQTWSTRLKNIYVDTLSWFINEIVMGRRPKTVEDLSSKSIRRKVNQAVSDALDSPYADFRKKWLIRYQKLMRKTITTRWTMVPWL